MADAALAPEAGRLTLEQCRALLPPGIEVADEELKRVRDDLYHLAEVTLDATRGSHLHPR